MPYQSAPKQTTAFSGPVRPASVYIPGDDDQIPGPRRIIIAGSPGIGKTQLAATFPDALIMDIDWGASTTKRPLLRIPKDETAAEVTRDVVNAMSDGRFADGVLTFQYNGTNLRCGTLVVDSVDMLQSAIKPFILKKRLKMEQEDWGILLEYLRNIFQKMYDLPVHIVLIAHERIEARGRNENPIPRRTLAVQGALAGYLVQSSDLVCYMLMNRENQRVLVAKEQVYENEFIHAKDRYGIVTQPNVFAGRGVIPISNQPSGRPTDAFARLVTSRSVELSGIQPVTSVPEDEDGGVDTQHLAGI